MLLWCVMLWLLIDDSVDVFVMVLLWLCLFLRMMKGWVIWIGFLVGIIDDVVWFCCLVWEGVCVLLVMFFELILVKLGIYYFLVIIVCFD